MVRDRCHNKIRIRKAGTRKTVPIFFECSTLEWIGVTMELKCIEQMQLMSWYNTSLRDGVTMELKCIEQMQRYPS